MGKDGDSSLNMRAARAFCVAMLALSVCGFSAGCDKNLIEEGIRESFLTGVRSQIEKSGRLSEVKVETSSGNVFFDQAALRAVLAASPLAPLPREFGESTLGVHFEFVQTP